MRSYLNDPERTEVGPSLARKVAIYAQMEQIENVRRTDEEDEFSEYATRIKEQVNKRFEEFYFFFRTFYHFTFGNYY